MRLIYPGLVLTVMAGSASAQGNWQPQASPSPAPPIYVSPPAPPPAPRPPSGKERAARPTGNPGLWVTNSDYPVDAMRGDVEGTTGFRLTIDRSGKVIRCDITMPSGSVSLDTTACRLMTERGKFSPALDAKGKPTMGTWASRVRWALPDNGEADFPYPRATKIPDPFAGTMSFIVEADGTVSNCSGTGTYANLATIDAACGNGARAQPFLDAAGKPVRKKVTISASLTVSDPDAATPAAPTTRAPVADKQP